MTSSYRCFVKILFFLIRQSEKKLEANIHWLLVWTHRSVSMNMKIVISFEGSGANQVRDGEGKE